jgi:hypothetical protein
MSENTKEIMTADEQTIILDLMQKNHFKLSDSESSVLCFQKTENDELVQVSLSDDFPYYVENKYAHADLPGRWAKQTLMLKSFEKVKSFAEHDVIGVVENLKKEFDGKLKMTKNL